MMVTPYQPRWVRGRATTPGERDAETRYLAIRDFLHESSMRTGLPIGRVLDLGAYGGYFSFRLAEDFGCQVVAIDDHPELRRGIDANRNPLVTGLYRRMSVDDLRSNYALGEFDVVLALSVLHHVEQWADMMDTLLDLSSQYLFIETPGPDEHLPKAISPLEQIRAAVEKWDGETIAEVAGYDGRYTRELKVVKL